MIDAWNRYWFRPGKLHDLAILRIVLVAFQLAWLALSDFDERLVARATDGAAEAGSLLLLPLLALPVGGLQSVDLETARSVLVIAYCAGGLALVGLATRISTIVFAWTQLLLMSWIYAGERLHHPEALLIVALVALAASPSGGALSMDRAIRPNSETTSPWASWPLLLVRWLLALAYLSAAWSKLATAGLDWANGYTLQYFTFVKGMALDRELGIWISENHLMARALSIFALAFEATFIVALFRPRMSALYVAAGCSLHIGIYLTIGAPFFQFIALYSAFLPVLLRSRDRAAPSPRLDDALEPRLAA